MQFSSISPRVFLAMWVKGNYEDDVTHSRNHPQTHNRFIKRDINKTTAGRELTDA